MLQEYLRRIGLLLVGLLVSAIGITLMLQANIGGVAEFFRGGSGGYVIFTLWQRLCQHIGYEQVRVAQLQDMVADGPIAAVIKVNT